MGNFAKNLNLGNRFRPPPRYYSCMKYGAAALLSGAGQASVAHELVVYSVENFKFLLDDSLFCFSLIKHFA